MKRTLPIFLLSVLTGTLYAQITITNETFPVAGDTLRTAIDNTAVPLEVQYLMPGGGQNWDFSFLSKDILRTTVYRPASEGAAFGNFPDTELVTIDPTDTENYYDVNSTSLRLVGQNGIGVLDVLIPIEMHVRYNPPLTEREVPLAFFDIHQYSSGILYPFAALELPAELLSLLPITPDSLRFRAAISQLDVSDAFGTATIPGGVYEVLRKKRTTYTEKRLDAKVPPLGWLDITDVAIQSLGLNSLGVDTLYYYFYFSAMEKEPIVVVGYNPVVPGSYDRVPIVEFKDVATTCAVGDFSGTQPELILSPNPATDQVHYTCRHFSPGEFVLHFIDASGNLLMTQQLTSSTGMISLEVLPSGMYFYQVLDEKERVMVTGKLLKSEK